MNEQPFPLRDRIVDERHTLLQQLQDWLEIPMLVLAFIWLALMVVEIVWGLNPLVESVGYIIWVIFILDFILEFWLAPEKLDYLKKNWLSGIALMAPALRALRLVRVVRLARLGRIAPAPPLIDPVQQILVHVDVPIAEALVHIPVDPEPGRLPA